LKQPAGQKKVIIIGAGISGLSAGCYLQRCGFKTEIFEKHDLPGGLCTSWTIGDYTFDGCLQWLLGSDEGNSFYKMWNEILDMPAIKFINHTYRILLEVEKNENKYGNKLFYYYNDLNRFEQYLLDLSPEDGRLIRDFISDVRYLQRFDLPPVLKDEGWWKNLKIRLGMVHYTGILFKFLKLKNETNKTFARKFKSPFLAEVFDQLYDQFEVNMLVVMFPMAAYDLQSAGYPEGGSLEFARKIEQSYLSAGGLIHYKTPVLKINAEDKAANSIIVRNNQVHQADYYISSCDWKFTIQQLLDSKYDSRRQKLLIEHSEFIPYFSSIQCSFGVKCTLHELPHFTRFPLDTPIDSPDGMIYHRFEVHVFNYDRTLAPENKTCIVVNFYTEHSAYWIDLRKTKRVEYRSRKQEFIQQVKSILAEKIPHFDEHLEVEDMTTPATYLRYTNNWLGSTQGWLPHQNILRSTPVSLNIPGLDNVFMASHWNQPGGGLPIAISKGREVAALLCKKEGVKFL